MALIDYIQDAVHKFIPQKKETYPKPLNTTSGGIGHGMQFDDEMPLSKPAIVYYTCQLFFTFVAICCFASVASFQAQWKIGPSGLTGFALFVGITSFFLSAFLLVVPVVYDKWDRCVRLARALQEVRVMFILATSGLVWSLLISFVTTISAFTQPGCKNPDNDPHASLGDTFKKQLGGWCSTKKAGAVFFWLAFAAWVATFVVAVLEWRSGKVRGRRRNTGREESFVPPAVDDSESVFSRNDTEYRRPQEDDEDEDDRHNDHRSPFADQAPQLPPPSFALDPQPRASMDAYGAFSDPAPSGYGGNAPTSPVGAPQRHGTSPTTPSDPYAQIQLNIGGSPAFGSSIVPPAPAPVPAPAPAPAPSIPYTSAPPLYTSTPPATYGADTYGGATASYGQAGGFVAPAPPQPQPGQYQYPTYQ